jgi:hypothetical protein
VKKRVKKDSSLPDGKDQRLITVVQEEWAKYQGQEKRFSKTFALALIDLHKQLAKPGHGSFVEKLKELKIPNSTAYRLMKLHGWQPDGRRKAPRKKVLAPKEREDALFAYADELYRDVQPEVRKKELQHLLERLLAYFSVPATAEKAVA